jgi:Protein of unknown function (DUF4236)
VFPIRNLSSEFIRNFSGSQFTMGLRFRRRITIVPGVHLNISRSGISTSVGVRGASLTLGKRGTYGNIGLPGTGISYRERISPPNSTHPTTQTSNILPNSEATNVAPATHFTHHLHWWKVLVFLGMMIAVGATKSNGIIGLFWCIWLVYLLFLFLRLIVRAMRPKPKQFTGTTN